MDMKNITLVIAVIAVALLAAWQFGLFGGTQQTTETTTPPAPTTEPATQPPATTQP